MSFNPVSFTVVKRRRRIGKRGRWRIDDFAAGQQGGHLYRKIDTDEAAGHVGLAASTLEKLRVFGGGPKYLKIGRRVVYDPADLDHWLITHRRVSTRGGSMSDVVTYFGAIAPNAEAMREHLAHLFGGFLDGCQDGLIELAYSDATPNDAGRYPLRRARLFKTDEVEELVDLACKMNVTAKCNVYIGAALRKPDTAPFARASDSDFYAATAMYADLDDAQANASAKTKWGDTLPTFVVCTGVMPFARHQMWFKFDVPVTDPALLSAMVEAASAHFGGDPSVKNPSRVMRLAGSIAWDQKPGRVPEATFIRALKGRQPASYPIERLAKVFKPVAPPQLTLLHGGAAAPLTLGYEAVRRVDNGLENLGKDHDGRETKMRDMILASISSYARQNGTWPTEGEVIADAWPAYERSTDFSRSGRGYVEFVEKVRYTLRRATEGKIAAMPSLDAAIAYTRPGEATQATLSPPVAVSPKTVARFKYETIFDLRSLPPMKWLVHGWVPAGAVGMLYGKWAAGKSFIAFDLAQHLAHAMPDWHGEALPKGGCDVLIIAREGHQGFVQRISAFNKKHGVEDTDRLDFMRSSVSMLNDEDFAGLRQSIIDRQAARGITYKLIIVDTVARVLPGVDMNEQKTVTLFTERCNLLSDISAASVLGVHHENKTGGSMGSVYFEANADFVYQVSRIGSDDAPLTTGTIKCTKMKDAADGWTKQVSYEVVQLNIVGDGASSLVVGAMENSGINTSKRAKDPWARGTLLELKRALFNVLSGQGAIICPFVDGPAVRAVPEAEVRREFEKSYSESSDDPKTNKKSKQKAWQRQTREAQAAGLVGVREVNGQHMIWIAKPPSKEN